MKQNDRFLGSSSEMESEFHFEFSQRRVGKDDVVYSDISEMFKFVLHLVSVY